VLVKRPFFHLLLIVSTLAASASLYGAEDLPVADIYFADKVERGVTIISRTETEVVYRNQYGKISCQIVSIKRIDPPNAGLKETDPIIPGLATPEPSIPAPVAETAPASTPAETPAETVPAATEPATNAFGTPVTTPEPAPSAEPTIPTPAATESVPTSEPEPTVMQEPPPPPSLPSEPPSVDRKYSAKFDILLVFWLALAAGWMRSVQWVQRHLAARKADPKFWTLVALLLPGAGAAAYAAAMKVSGQQLDIEPPAAAPKPDAAPQPPLAPPAGPTRPPRPPAAAGTSDAKRSQPIHETAPAPAKKPAPANSPAVDITRKCRTPRGFDFVDAAKRIPATDASLAEGLCRAGEMIDEALFERASDVHIEPTVDDYKVRFRLDGLLQERMRYPREEGHLVLAALKTMAELDAAEELKPQDGRFQMRSGDRLVDLRIATTSSFHGEKIVVRLLDHGQAGFDLGSLGFDEKSLDIFTEILQSRDGTILATGPSGSGKSATLYAALRSMDASRLNIMTIEDPPEYELAGTTQLSVNPKAGISYESGLQSIMRQDPDVILIGEITDLPTMKAALSSSGSGHLVLGSFHAPTAVAAITRLREMGIENYQIAAATRLILCQRLVRVLCTHCRHPFPAKGTELASLGMELEAGSILHAATGCEHCLDTGYRGRTALFEMLVVDEDVRRAIGDGADEETIIAVASEKRFHTYQFNGAQKILAGITTVEELLQTA